MFVCLECEDWKENINKLNAPFLEAAARSGNPHQYMGKVFEFCPWCGRRLSQVKDSEEIAPDGNAADSLKAH